MSPTETDIPNNPDALKAFIADMQAKLAASESARLASEQALAAEHGSALQMCGGQRRT